MSECGHLNGGKSKAVTYAFPPGYRENAEEEEEEEKEEEEEEKFVKQEVGHQLRVRQT
jgi:hypothetical protein